MAPSRVAHFFDKCWSLRSILSGHNFSGDDAQKNSSNGAKSRLVMLFKRVFLHGWTDFQPLPAPPYEIAPRSFEHDIPWLPWLKNLPECFS